MDVSFVQYILYYLTNKLFCKYFPYLNYIIFLYDRKEFIRNDYLAHFGSLIHFDHKNILKYCNRPFQDVDHMAEILVRNWNTVVDPSDMVFIVGDFAMGRREETLPIAKRLNGFKVLVPGNHDHCHPMYDDASEKYKAYKKLYEEYFDDIVYDHVYQLEDFILCHFPYSEGKTDYAGRDFSEWEPMDIGMPLLCGHVHELWRIKLSPNGTWMFNVGVDAPGNDYAPVSLDYIKTLYFDLLMH